MTPITYYQQALTLHGFAHDPAQEQAVYHLQRLYDELLNNNSTLTKRPGDWSLSRFIPQLFGWQKVQKWQPCRGLYFWGGVGRGKTWLVDSFFEALPFEQKMRLHFHRFMKRVHRELQQRRGQKNPLVLIAQQLASEARVICLDEFFVADITDAMLLAGLLDGLFQQGVTLVVTSNIVPDQLYRDGLQRDKFLPAITLLKQHLEVVNVDGGLDHRLRLLEQADLYYFPYSADTEQKLAERFQQLTHGRNDKGQRYGANRDFSIAVNERLIPVVQLSQDVVWFTFDALCNTPRSQNDYIELACEFHTVLISDLPQLGCESEDQTRRFISLIDEFYDRGVKLIMSGAVSLPELYVGDRLSFEFQRTLSRLQEMQSRAYLGRTHKS